MLKNNLAVERNAFIGRTAQIDEIRRLCDEGAQIVTILGAPGVGKTRLARRVAALFLEAIEDGDGSAWFCDLTDAKSPDDLFTVIGQVLDVPLTMGSGASDTADQLGRAIAGRGDVLLVIDNFERLVESAATILQSWTDLAPRATFLVTSRERLRVEAEQSVELDTLAVPLETETNAEAVLASEAVTLWIQRAKAVRAGYTVSPSDVATIAAITRHLDGLPLAIELCASRLRMLGPSQLLERLQHRFEVLVGATRDASSRHATLRSAIDWSWNLLEPVEQQALQQCSVFRGGFGPESAEAVLALGDGAPPVLQILEALHDKSLIRTEEAENVTGERRYRLYESIREYTAEKYGAGGAAETRHADHFVKAGLRWADDTHGSGAIDALGHLTLERDNLLAVHDRAMTTTPRTALQVTTALEVLAALRPLFYARGSMSRFADLLGAATRAAVDVGVAPEIESNALSRLAHCLVLTRGAFDEALVHCDRAIALAEESRSTSAKALAFTISAAIRSMKRSDDDAEARFGKARAALDATSNPNVETLFARYFGQHLSRTGRFDAAIATFERALDLARRAGCTQEEGQLLGGVGIRYMERGAFDEARARLTRATSLLHPVGDRCTEGICLGVLGMIDQEQGMLEAAHGHLTQALQIQREVGALYYEQWALVHLGNVAFEAGSPLDASKRYREALALTNGVGDARITHAMLAAALARLGYVEDAEVRVEEARRSFGSDALPAFKEAFELLEAQIDVALARRALLREDTASATETITAITALVRREPTATGSGAEDARLARRLLKQALDEAVLALRDGSEEILPYSERAPPAPEALRVGADGRWFQIPGGERVDLRRRAVLSRFLAALTTLRLATPDQALPLHDVVDAVWAGERMQPEAAAARVYTTVKYLRRMGLRDLLISREDGYLLEPTVRVVWGRD